MKTLPKYPKIFSVLIVKSLVMYYEYDKLPVTLDEATSHETYESPSSYDLDNFDSNNGVMVKSLKSIDGVNLEGYLDLNPIFSITGDLEKVVAEVDSMIGSKLRSFGSGALFYYENGLAIVVFIEDWNEGCVPREKKEIGNQTDYAEKSSHEIITETNNTLPEGRWDTFHEGYDPHYGGVYGQTVYMKVNNTVTD